MNLLPAVLALATPVSPSADDVPEWGGFRGNNGAGISETSTLPKALDKEVNLLWQTDIPAGYSSVVVAGERAFLTGVKGRKLVTLAIDVVTGEVVWSREVDYDGSRVGANSAAAPTPATDGEHVFSLFHHVGMIAYDVKGEELWRNDLGAPFEIPHGLATSPVLNGDTIVLQLDQNVGSRLVALDKGTGEERWSIDRPGAAHSYATPVIHTPDEGPPQVIVSGSYQIAAFSLEDGERLWWVGGTAWQTKSLPVIHGDLCIVNSYMVPSSEFGAPAMPLSWEELLVDKDADGDGLVGKDELSLGALDPVWFIFDLDGDAKLNETDYAYLKSMGTATGGVYAIKLGGKGDVTETHVAWVYDKRRGLSDVTSPVLVGDTLFLLKEGGLLTAIDSATGEVIKQGRVGDPDAYFASPITAGGRLLTASRGGLLTILDGGPEWKEISTLDLGEDVWSTPALAGGLLFVRSQSALYCFFDEEQ